MKTHLHECLSLRSHNYLYFESSIYPSEIDFECELCKKQFPFSYMIFNENCIHSYCKECVPIVCKGFKCPNTTCHQFISENVLKLHLSPKDFDQYLDTSIQDALSQSDTFVKCPNCQLCCERVSPLPQTNLTEVEMWKERYRFRCRGCLKDFCCKCSVSPYHENFTCHSHQTFITSKHCKYCDCVITTNEYHCNQLECLEKNKIACKKILECGGVSGEEKCLKCLDCNRLDDYCNICFIETLPQAPCVELTCGHIFHYECIKKKLEMKWSGTRVVFGFLNCPLCNQIIDSPVLKSILTPILTLYDRVKTMALQRLDYEGLSKHKDITEVGGKYFQNPTEFAMTNFSYHICYKCESPYFGGMKRCDQNLGDGIVDFDPKDLLCASCSSNQEGYKNCEKHGKENMEYKCRFCCNLATFACWGATTRFCDQCHEKQMKNNNFAKTKSLWSNTCVGSTCPSGGEKYHGPHGKEFLIGCSICKRINF
jgi:hypothetical protein